MSQTILYTGTNPQRYDALGEIVHFPMIELNKLDLSKEEIKAIIDKVNQSHMILLTSRFAVKHFLDVLKSEDYPISDLEIKDFVVIGEDTANILREYRLEPALIPTDETSQGLFKAMQDKFSLENTHILFPRSSLPNPFLKEHLQEAGAIVDELTMYKNNKPERRELPEVDIDTIIFTSPSTVNNFIDDYKEIPKEWKILAKGTLTYNTLKSAGYNQAEINNE